MSVREKRGRVEKQHFAECTEGFTGLYENVVICGKNRL